MTQEELLCARAEEALAALRDIEEFLAGERAEASSVVRDRLASALRVLCGEEDAQLSPKKAEHLCIHSDCPAVALAGSSFCWYHVINARVCCVVKGCGAFTPPTLCLCQDHMKEYIAEASRTGEYSLQGWLLRRSHPTIGAKP